MSDMLLERATAFVDTATNPGPGQAETTDRRRWLGRAVKIGLAGALLAGAFWAVLAAQSRVTVDNAVVSAYVVSARSPIQGEVSGLQLRVGDTVRGTALLAHVFNDRVSDEHLIDLRSGLAKIQADRAALEAQRQALTELRAGLAARSEAYRTAQIAYTAASSNEGAAQLVGSSLRMELAQHDMGRKVSLGRSGDAAAADVDHATLDARVAEAAVTSQAAHLAYLRAKEAAATHGLFLDTGANDVTYSAQRIDEIDLRLADSDRARAELAAGQAAAELRLAAEERRFAELSEANIGLSANGMVWKLAASNGEWIGMGDTLAQVVDCGASFIVASIPQRQFSSVAVGSLARFRLSGETTDRQGRVISVIGDSSVSIDRNLAATPVADHATTAVVRIEVPPSANNGAECLVGRTARVILPSANGGLLAQLRQWLP